MGQPGLLAHVTGKHLALGIAEQLGKQQGGRHARPRALVEEDVLHRCRGRRANTQDAGAARLDDCRLLGGNGLDRVAQHMHVVEPHARDGDRSDGLCRTRGVPTPTHAAFEHGDVDAGFGVDHHGGYREQVELRDVIGALASSRAALVHASPRLDGSRDATGELLLADGPSVDLHALGVAHQLGAGVERRTVALPHEDGGSEARGRRLAIGARHLDAVEGEVGVTQLGEHVLDRLEHGADAKPENVVQDVEGLLVGDLGDGDGHRVGHLYASFLPKASQ